MWEYHIIIPHIKEKTHLSVRFLSIFFRLMLGVQGIHHDIRIRIDDDGAVGMVNDHAGLGTGFVIQSL